MERRWIVVLAVLFVTAGAAFAGFAAARTFGPQKEHLDRDSVYYQIENDAGDYGNFWETYMLPVSYRDHGTLDRKQGRVFCAVYSDKIGDGGGAAGNCDFEGFYRTHPRAVDVRSAG